MTLGDFCAFFFVSLICLVSCKACAAFALKTQLQSCLVWCTSRLVAGLDFLFALSLHLKAFLFFILKTLYQKIYDRFFCRFLLLKLLVKWYKILSNWPDTKFLRIDHFDQMNVGDWAWKCIFILYSSVFMIQWGWQVDWQFISSLYASVDQNCFVKQ